MGGDHAPGAVVEGAALAVREKALEGADLLLVGREEAVAPLLEASGLQDVELLHAPQVIGMDDPPSTIRTRPGSSIVLGMKAVAEGRARAFVSAGNTGAVVAASSLVLGRLPGVSRPGIAVPVPTDRGPCVVIDVGANIYCKPEHMLQYGMMASEYCKAAFGRDNPVVGLLNVGAEEGKGNPLIQEVHGLLQGSGLNYRGFVEGQDILGGEVHVVVCEGFVGNAILKVAEGLAAFVATKVRAAFEMAPPREEVRQAVSRAFAQLDYAEYGGAPLLGVTAPVLIGHGRSSPHAVMNMLRAAQTVLQHDITRHITERLASSGRRVS